MTSRRPSSCGSKVQNCDVAQLTRTVRPAARPRKRSSSERQHLALRAHVIAHSRGSGVRCSPRVASRGSQKDAHQARAPKNGSERSATGTGLSHAYFYNSIAAGSLEKMVCGPGPPAHAVHVRPVVIDTAWVHSEREEEKREGAREKG